MSVEGRLSALRDGGWGSLELHRRRPLLSACFLVSELKDSFDSVI